jgi:hypothetical protein
MTNERIALTCGLQFRVEAGCAELVGTVEFADEAGGRIGAGYCYRIHGEPFIATEAVIERTGHIVRAKLDIGGVSIEPEFGRVCGIGGGEFHLATSIPSGDCTPSPEMVELTAEIRRACTQREAEGRQHLDRIASLDGRFSDDPDSLTTAELRELLADADDEYECRRVADEAIKRLESLEDQALEQWRRDD